MEDNLSKMEQIHNNVFDFLLEKHFEEKKKGNEFFFKTRQRFSKGKENLWFLGNESYAAISFWTGTNYQNKTPNIYLEIHLEGRVALFVVGKGSEEQKRFFSVLSNETSDYKILNLNTLDNGVWIKNYTINHKGEYLNYLNEFLESDKKIIDTYLSFQDSFVNDGVATAATTIINNSIPLDDEEDYSETYPRKLTRDEFYKMLTGVMDRKYETPDYFFNEPKKYPYRGLVLGIKSFEVRNYRGIEHLKIDGIPIDTKWIVLTGENGFGKSSVLQSIAIGLCGNTDGSYQLLDDNGFVMLEGQRGNGHFLNLSFNFNTKNPFNSIKENVAAYGATRLNIGNDSSRPDAASILYNLFFPNGSLVNIETILRESFAYNPEKFNLLKNAFRKLIPDLDDIIVDTINKNPVVKYIERESKEYVTFEQLASGFRNIIAVVGDIITKLSKTNELQNLSSLKGIVIIDEIELHLHPKYQKNLPKILSEIFPNILFIVSTHSPIPLLGMPKETVLLQVNRCKEKGITIERLDIDFTNLLPNAILTSPIFGFQEIIPTGHNKIDIINVADSYEEAKQNEEIENKISNFLSPEKTAEFLKLIKK